LGLPVKRDEWTFIDLPRNSEPEMKDLNTKMAVVNFVEQEKLVWQFKLSTIFKYKIKNNFILCFVCIKSEIMLSAFLLQLIIFFAIY
jgi:hypothetical protein